jgi:hypothetical protein
MMEDTNVMKKIRLYVLVAIWLTAALVTRAQLTSGDVLGTVTDTTGAVVSDAKVTLTNTETGVKQVAATNGTGDYSFNLLIPGKYTVSVEAKGFKKTSISNFALAAGDRLRENASLQPGSVEETVEVTSAAPLLQTDSSTVQSTVTEQSVQDLPLNGRNFINLVQLQPGVNQGQPNAISSGTRPDNRAQTSTVVANGQSDLFNNEMIDGMDNNEREQGFIGISPSVDAIAEVQVETSNFTAEVGRSGGAVINIITKSGTDHFHGSLFEYFRNDIFDARDWFAKVGTSIKPEYRQNQFGGSLGGPIVKNKTFFFGDVQDNRIVQGKSSGNLSVPTVQENPNCSANKTGNYDFTDNGGTLVLGSKADPVGATYFKMFPCPNLSATSPTQNYSTVVSSPQTTLAIDGRIDQHLKNGDTLFGRYSYNKVNTFTPGYFPAVTISGVSIQPNGGASYPGTSTTVAHGVALSYSHMFTPNLVMELKTGYTRIAIDTQNLNPTGDVSAKIGLVNANTTAAPHAQGLTPVAGGLGDSIYIPIIDTNNTFMYMGSLLYTHGAHSLKFGAEVTRRQLNYFQSSFPLGYVIYAGLTGNTLEDLAVGRPFGWMRGNLLVAPGYRGWDEGYYAQDDWRVNTKLTVNIGLRYDLYTPVTEAHGQQSNFLYPTLTLVTGQQDPHMGIKTATKDFAPRVGFSESILPKTVLRGGFGISYFPTDTQTRLQNSNPPYTYSASCFGCFGWWPVLPVPTASSTSNLSGSLSYLPSNLNTAYVEQFNLMVQQQFGANVLTVGGVGELGRHALFNTTANEPAPTGPYANPQTTPPSAPPSYTTATTLPNVGSISQYSENATSNYYALQVVYARRFTKGLEFNANYTWAHELSDGYLGSGLGGVAGLLPNNPRYDYGSSTLDIRHRLGTTLTYALPFGNNLTGVAGLLAKGWTANMILFWQSGQPFAVSDTYTKGNTAGVVPINTTQTTTDRPNVVAHQNYKSGQSGLGTSSYLNSRAWTPQAFGTAGNEANLQYFGPHTRRPDVSLFKNFALPEKMTLQFRAEVYNLSNTPNFAAPASALSAWNEGSEHDFLHPIKSGDYATNTGTQYCTKGTDAGCTPVGLLPGDTGVANGQKGSDGTAATFGSITSTAQSINPRQFQFALKLLF